MSIRLNKQHSNRLKSNQRSKQLSAEQKAQLNLIQISTFQYLAADQLPNNITETPKKQQEKPSIKIRTLKNNHNLFSYANKSQELRKSVSDKTTESFNLKAGRKSSCLQLHSDEVCVIRRKLPLSISSFMVIGEQQKKHVQPISPSSFRPRASINTRTYFRKNSDIKKVQQLNSSHYPKYESRKLYPFEESYWKIFKVKLKRP